ncbi:membrane protein [Arthrobacter phage Jinkies]|uniref:Membrane protein n=1 Tax=Arthrobacter phage Jinkies TaxID=2743903 RepID=A0A7S5WT22_9CAUD|nr:membrane protein [Arthrobacter phage Jinkies]
MTRIVTALGRLTRTDWAFVHFKAALGILLMTPLVQLESLKSSTTVWFLCVWATVTIIGFWVSVAGLVMSAQKYETRHKGFVVEMTGLVLLLIGPAVFAAIQAGVWISTGQSKAVSIAFCYVIITALVARMVMVKGAAKSRTVIYRYKESLTDD